MIAHLFSRSSRSIWLAATLLLVGVAPVQAVSFDAGTLFGNYGFETGNLNGWAVTQPNSTNYVSALVPPVNPAIDPADPANNPQVLLAPVGSYFTGLANPGDLNRNYKLEHVPVAVSLPSGSALQTTVFASRGRLEPFDSPPAPPGSSVVTVKIFGWTTNGSAPTVTPSTDDWSRSVNWNPSAKSFDFTLQADGTWGSQTFIFDPAASGIDASNLKYLAMSIVGKNVNHDNYVATDLAPVPEPMTAALMGIGLVGIALLKRWRAEPERP